MPAPVHNSAMVQEALGFLTSAYAFKAVTPNLQAFLSAIVQEIQVLEDQVFVVLNGRILATIPAVVPLTGVGQAPYGPGLAAFYTQVQLQMTPAAGTYLAGTLSTALDIYPGQTFTNVSTVVSTGAPLLVLLQGNLLNPIGTVNSANIVFDLIGKLVGQPRAGLSDPDFRAIIYLKIAVLRSFGRTTDWSNIAQILEKTSVPVDLLVGPATYVEGEAGFSLFIQGMTLNPNIVASVIAGAVPNGVGADLEYSTPSFPRLLFTFADSVTGGGNQHGFGDFFTGGSGIGGDLTSAVRLS